MQDAKYGIIKVKGGGILNKPLIFVIFAYTIAFLTNLIPSIKHPDSNMSTLNLVVSVFFLVVVSLYIKKVPNRSKATNGLMVFLIVGFFSGVIVYFLKTYEHLSMENAFLDVIASIQYPFYIIFTIPLFGLNSLIDINYGLFSLLMSVLYLIAIIFLVTSKRFVHQKFNGKRTTSN